MAWLSVGFPILAALLSLQDWDRAEREIKRHPPSAFRTLPAAIQADLTRRGCTIPQPFTAKAPENVISGAFTRRGQVDWAVLCSINGDSSVLVFRAGSTRNVMSMESAPDSRFLQVVDGNNGVGFSRAIRRANGRHILRHYRDHGGPKPPPLDHDGIEHYFIEKASSILYWYRGEWLTLQGSD
jgi:hypothetical protein